MSKFADSPYFLLKDYLKAVVAPPNPVYLQPDIINMDENTLYTDVIWVGGVTNRVTSSPYVNNLDGFPSFDPGIDDATIFESEEIVWNGWYDRSSTNVYHLDDPDGVGVIMRGMEKSIIVDGGQYIDLWALTDTGYVQVRLKPLYEDPVDKQYFRFDEVELQTLNYDGTNTTYDSDVPADEPYYDSDYVSIQTLDYTYTLEFFNGETLPAGTEIYIRKDSNFHGWLKNENFAKQFYQDEFELDFMIRNYVNTDKLFLYFGKIYPSPTDSETVDRYHIDFYGLKDWIKRAVPPNNRKELFMEFLDYYFDMVYSEGYNQLKDVWSLRDAMECDEKYLAYIPTFYDVKRYDDMTSWFAEIYREYARDVVWLMKRKGTYASLYAITDVLTSNSDNLFNVMERWHVEGAEVDGVVSDYEDHIYKGQYYWNPNSDEPGNGDFDTGGAGVFWYQKYDTASYPDGYLSSDDKRLSPYYRCDLDISVEPLTDTQIMPKQIAENLYENWEMMRPIHRQAEYNFVFSPYCDLTGDNFTLYQPPNTTQAITKAQKNITFDVDNFIYVERAISDTWNIEHNLGTENVVVSVYQGDPNDSTKIIKAIPEVIRIVDENNITVEHSVATDGLVIVSKAYGSSTTYDPIIWRVTHGYGREEVIIQIRNTSTNEMEYPVTVDIFDASNVDISGLDSGEDYKAFIKPGLTDGESIDEGGTPLDSTIWTFPYGGTLNVGTGLYEWVIEHDYPEKIFMVDCYDSNNELMIPESIDLGQVDGSNNPIIIASFTNNVTGFAAIDHIGDAVAFEGILPRGVSGDLTTVEWRLSIETDTDIYTFLREGTPDAERFVNSSKTVHYWDGINSNKNFPYGTTELEEEDSNWAYYTFKVSDEALKQLNIKDYKIIGIELTNTNIRRTEKQRIIYTRLTGIYKPFGANFVGHYRIFKSPDGIGEVALDEDGSPLLDENGELIYT